MIKPIEPSLADAVTRMGEPSKRNALSFPMLGASLVRNGYALIFNTGLTAGLGLLFWIFAARLYSIEQVGIGTALLAVFQTLSNLSQLAFGNLVNRFLPIAGNNSGRMIAITALSTAVLAGTFAITFLAASNSISPALVPALSSLSMQLMFTAATALWAIFSLLDNVFTGLRRSELVAIKNAAHSVVKILLLVALTRVAFFPNKIFAAWVVTLPLFVLIPILFIQFRILAPAAATAVTTETFTLGRLANFLGWDYFGTIMMVLATSVSPILAINFAGPSSAAVYNLAWTAAFSIYLVGRAMSSSLTVESAINRRQLAQLVSDATAHTLMVLLPVVLAVILLSRPIMLLFGEDYADEGAGILRILALQCVPWSLVSIHLVVARAVGQMRWAAIVQGITAVLGVVFGLFSVRHFGALGLATSWLLAQSCALSIILIRKYIKQGAGSIVVLGLGLASAVSRIVDEFKKLPTSRHPLPGGNRDLVELLVAAGVALPQNYSLVSGNRTQSDVKTQVVIDQNGKASYYFKESLSLVGAESMRQSSRLLAKLNERLHSSKFKIALPNVLSAQQHEGVERTLERALEGTEGRVLCGKLPNAGVLLAPAMRAINQLRSQDSSTIQVDETWLSNWISSPAEVILAVRVPWMTTRVQKTAVVNFTQALRHYWLGRTINVGIGHGDYCLGNLLYAPKTGFDSQSLSLPGKLEITAILDWDQGVEDAPFGLDECFLLLSARIQATGQEFGEIVRDFLVRPVWTHEEILALRDTVQPANGGNNAPWFEDAQANRALAGLAWLRHTVSNLEKSERYHGSWLWKAWNMQRVLDLYRLPTISTATNSIVELSLSKN
jgi:O-antigen/teichoic acid export membrane protein